MADGGPGPPPAAVRPPLAVPVTPGGQHGHLEPTPGGPGPGSGLRIIAGGVPTPQQAAALAAALLATAGRCAPPGVDSGGRGEPTGRAARPSRWQRAARLEAAGWGPLAAPRDLAVAEAPWQGGRNGATGGRDRR